MESIIKRMLNKAYSEEDLELAELANNLMCKFADTCNCPSDWHNITEELFEEYQNNEWLMNAVYEFSILADEENEEE